MNLFQCISAVPEAKCFLKHFFNCKSFLIILLYTVLHNNNSVVQFSILNCCFLPTILVILEVCTSLGKIVESSSLKVYKTFLLSDIIASPL